MDIIGQLHRALGQHAARIVAPVDRTHAAVALTVRQGPGGGLDILLIVRSKNDNDFWSGQISLPGGRTETRDKDSRDTAEREAKEELGVDLKRARYLGRLSDLVPGGLNIVISPFVYEVPKEMDLEPDRSEVADVFWFPLEELKNRANFSSIKFMFHGKMRRFPSLLIKGDEEQHLWGITYRLLCNLNKIIATQVADEP